VENRRAEPGAQVPPGVTLDYLAIIFWHESIMACMLCVLSRCMPGIG
jgi:hypothetical protein